MDFSASGSAIWPFSRKGVLMLRYCEENYGADADGLRGIPVTFYDLEQSDYDEVVRLIKEAQDQGDDGDIITISMVCPIDDEVIDFDVVIKDFL